MFKTALYHLPSCHIWIPRSFVCFFFIHSNYEIGIFRIISPGLLSSTCRHLKAGNTIVSSLPKSWLLFSSCVRCCLLGKMIDPEGERREDSFRFFRLCRACACVFTLKAQYNLYVGFFVLLSASILIDRFTNRIPLAATLQLRASKPNFRAKKNSSLPLYPENSSSFQTLHRLWFLFRE